MSNENNKMQVDIENLFKQNVNDLSAIKELYRKLKEVEEKITQIKYIDNTLVKKIKKEYEKLNKIILDKNIQVKLTNDIETINTQLDTIKNNYIAIHINKDDTQQDIIDKITLLKEQGCGKLIFPRGGEFKITPSISGGLAFTEMTNFEIEGNGAKLYCQP